MSYTFRQGDLPKLDLQTDRDRKACRSQWDTYFSLSGLGKESPAKQIQARHSASRGRQSQ